VSVGSVVVSYDKNTLFLPGFTIGNNDNNKR